MGWLLITLIIIVICLIWSYFEGENFSTGLIVGGVFSLFVVGILVVISLFCAEVIDTREEVQYKICGLENKYMDENTTKGAFILGTGGFSSDSNTELKYYFFREDENGKKLETINGSNIYIRETNEQEPCYIEKYNIIKNTGFFKWLFGDDEGETFNCSILVVPTDTIKIDYNVDI